MTPHQYGGALLGSTGFPIAEIAAQTATSRIKDAVSVLVRV